MEQCKSNAHGVTNYIWLEGVLGKQHVSNSIQNNRRSSQQVIALIFVLHNLPHYLNMLRNLFFFNVFATLGFGLQLALLPDFFMNNLGWQQVSDEAKAVAFIWGSAVQTGIAATQ